ncbi:hypothetical protein SAMN05444272_1290 [Roseibium suaedae]|uniref:Uncharacterized protein n=1 Tax=Roseibium suaedae TaxID=735517 RepID=A0A1M7CVJ6_9HYPH|nr:hypothetical protein SAMN05444272_1290 [Roseibium suaedae]
MAYNALFCVTGWPKGAVPLRQRHPGQNVTIVRLDVYGLSIRA